MPRVRRYGSLLQPLYGEICGDTNARYAQGGVPIVASLLSHGKPASVQMSGSRAINFYEYMV